ncbi:hypothetical protein GSI_06955 [Ganoderma sinense ZZ0214-1]|uniref:Uncharacterized protein n=1 Tax=Ganoderma sinense ZZ0214-1 TaxID=1077348 RepID=A0A2G8SAJ9_9APHY|nr:hypothetical protein GSI_06955 [Ganoderma sinense ZZ0214-1]
MLSHTRGLRPSSVLCLRELMPPADCIYRGALATHYYPHPFYKVTYTYHTYKYVTVATSPLLRSAIITIHDPHASRLDHPPTHHHPCILCHLRTPDPPLRPPGWLRCSLRTTVASRARHSPHAAEPRLSTVTCTLPDPADRQTNRARRVREFGSDRGRLARCDCNLHVVAWRGRVLWRLGGGRRVLRWARCAACVASRGRHSATVLTSYD